VDLADVRMRPAGELAQLLSLVGKGGDQEYTVTLSPVDFEVRDGGIRYENLTFVMGDGVDLRFHGLVRFDGSLDMAVSVPVKQSLLEKLGARGPLGEYAKALEGTRVEIPLAGSRTQPRLDLGKVDIKPLIQQAIQKVGLPGADLLPGLLPGSRSPASGPASGPASQPSGGSPLDRLRGLPLP
jgi:hypothetical protein